MMRLEFIIERAIAPDIILGIVAIPEVILENAITVSNPACNYPSPSIFFQPLVAVEPVSDFRSPAFCPMGSRLEFMIMVHDSLLEMNFERLPNRPMLRFALIERSQYTHRYTFDRCGSQHGQSITVPHAEGRSAQRLLPCRF
jgi:hypothetical protein